MRVLVTGGTGYLGAAIVRALAQRGHHAVVFARHASTADLPGTPIDGDVRDLAALRRGADAADAIVHAAALVSIWQPNPEAFTDVNVGGLHNVLEVAKALGTPRIVYTSSFLACPPAGRDQPLNANDYQRTKAEARGVAFAAMQRGAPLVLLYPGVIYGPGKRSEGNLVGRLLADHLAGRLPGIVGSDRIWSCAYVDDVAAAHVEAVERPNVAGEYGLGGENVQQIRIFDIAREACGAPLPRRIPIGLAYGLAAAEEVRARLAGTAPALTRGAVEIFSHDWPLDSGRSERELSYRVTPLPEGIRAVLASIR